jgi:hypothetical protein
MQRNRVFLGLCLLCLPLWLGNRGCDAEAHEADPDDENAAEIKPTNGEKDAAVGPGQGPTNPSGGPTNPSGGPTNPAPGDPPVKQDAAVQDAAVVAVDAGTTPVGKRCGTRGGVQCGANEFCDYVAASQCGALDQGGTCKPKTQACTRIYKPVCGCDGNTYGNECEAHSKGVSVASEGACGGKPSVDAGPGPGTGKMCGGFAGIACAKGEFCNYEVAAGGQGCENIADGSGVCQAVPNVCTDDYTPVCGCDRHTYSNACSAHSAGVSVMRTQACTDVDCKAIGGRPVDGIGPAPKCAAGETSAGPIRYANGQIAIEGTICCIK